MIKAGVILAVVALIIAIGVTLLLPYCTPCSAIVLGLAGGYLAGVFDKPNAQNGATKSGAIAGAIGGVGGLLGQMIGAVINGLVVGPEKAAQISGPIIESLGLPAGTLDSSSYWLSTIGINCCLGLVGIGIMAGLGALGGLIWWSTTGKKQQLPPVVPPNQEFPLQ
jgi:hypothetical protein